MRPNVPKDGVCSAGMVGYSLTEYPPRACQARVRVERFGEGACADFVCRQFIFFVKFPKLPLRVIHSGADHMCSTRSVTASLGL